MMDGLQNQMRRESERAMGRLALPRMGIVSSYDAKNYAAKVRIQPEDHETGWLPIASPFVGDGWGLAFGLTPGDVVDVHFQEGGKEAGYVSLRHYGDGARPPAVPSGEAWLLHQSGSLLKFLNDGSIAIHAASAITSSAPIWKHAGDVHVTGNILASGDITDVNDGGGSLAHLREAYDLHRHPGVQSGADETLTTDLPV